MASQSGREDAGIEIAARLREAPRRFEFFQAVRMLERSAGRGAVGDRADPADETVRFRALASLDFPESEIRQIAGLSPGAGAERAKSQRRDGQLEMTVSFMGLFGPLGVMPRHYTETVLELLQDDDNALKDFFDILHHRYIALFYRAWEKHRCWALFESALHSEPQDGDASLGSDRFSQHVLDLLGLSSKTLRSMLSVDGMALLFFAGLLAQQPRSASALRGVLEGYFGVSVCVIQLTGMWMSLAEEDRTRIGSSNAMLGVNAIAGARIWDPQAKFRLRLGPLPYDRFCSFLPSGKAFPALVATTRLFAGQEIDFDVQLVLQARDVPYCQLGDTGERAPRLGWSAWLKTEELVEDSDAVVLRGAETLVGAFAARA